MISLLFQGCFFNMPLTSSSILVSSIFSVHSGISIIRVVEHTSEQQLCAWKLLREAQVKSTK